MKYYSFDIYTKGVFNLTVPWYLMSSFLYYKPDIALMSDCEYDEMCRAMYERWSDIDHYHKYLINRESLKCGTGYDIKEYPLRVQQASLYLAKGRGLL